MRKIMIGLMMFLISETLLNAQTEYEIIPGSKGNQIILTIENESKENISNGIIISVVKVPSAIEIKNSKADIEKLEKGEEQEVSFIFDVMINPQNKNDTISFSIKDKYGNNWSKQIALKYSLPTEFALHQNYPNPFNPETTISYVIPNHVKNHKDFSSTSSPRNDNVHVTLKVYDILGREVATLVNEAQQPGMYNLKFTINSSLSTFTRLGRASSPLSTGIYFYRLHAGDFVSVKKMILMK